MLEPPGVREKDQALTVVIEPARGIHALHRHKIGQRPPGPVSSVNWQRTLNGLFSRIRRSPIFSKGAEPARGMPVLAPEGHLDFHQRLAQRQVRHLAFVFGEVRGIRHRGFRAALRFLGLIEGDARRVVGHVAEDRD